MATQEKNQACGNLIRKLLSGTSLDDAERSHLAACEGCMAEIVRTLDETATRETPGLDMNDSGSNGDLKHVRPAAQKALDRGRQVFEREFGVFLGKK